MVVEQGAGVYRLAAQVVDIGSDTELKVTVLRQHYRTYPGPLLHDVHRDCLDDGIGGGVDYKESGRLMGRKHLAGSVYRHATLTVVERACRVGVGLVVVAAGVGIARTGHLTFDCVAVEVEHPKTVGRRHIALMRVYSHEAASVALCARRIDNLQLRGDFHRVGIDHGDAAAGDGICICPMN